VDTSAFLLTHPDSQHRLLATSWPALLAVGLRGRAHAAGHFATPPPVDTANSIRVFGGWTFCRFRDSFQVLGIANWRSRRGSKTHKGQKRPDLNRVSLLSQVSSMLRKQRKGNVPGPRQRHSQGWLSGAPLISMMQSSHLGNSLDASIFWLVHRPRHRRIFGQC